MAGQVLAGAVAMEEGELVEEDGAQGEAGGGHLALVGTAPMRSKMPLNWALKPSMAWERRWWKRRRTSTPASGWG
jgi:hypothetical protein